MRMQIRAKALYLVVCALLTLTGCAGAADAPPELATPSLGAVPSFQPLSDILAAPPSRRAVTAAGYYYLGRDGPVLVDGLSFSGDAPQPLGAEPAQQLWLGEALSPAEVARASYAPALAQGILEGPGRYGPGGRFAFQLAGASLKPLTPINLTVQELLAKAFVYDGQLVRVRGALLLSQQSSLLVERLDDHGIPPAQARQVKLLPPFRDEALRARLPGASGQVRYGPVEVEGFWRGGALLPLGITPR